MISLNLKGLPETNAILNFAPVKQMLRHFDSENYHDIKLRQ